MEQIEQNLTIFSSRMYIKLVATIHNDNSNLLLLQQH